VTGRAFAGVLRRDLLLAARGHTELALPLLFYVLVATLVPLAVSPDAATLARLAPGIIWVGALLATLLSLDRLFRSDFEDGTLDLLLLSPAPLPLLVVAKVLAHWLATGLPLLLVSPLLALLLALPDGALGTLTATLALGTPVLSLIGAVGVALTVSVRRGGALLALLVLPLYVPVLIFGANAVAAAADGLPVTGQLYMLGAFLALSLSLAPLAAAGALRVTVS
jgi:heme exporter protein B